MARGRTNLLPDERATADGTLSTLSSAELDALERWADSGKASCSLVGPPGIGKTFLARHFAEREAARLGERFDEVWWCDLSHATSFDELVATVAHITQMPVRGGSTLEATANLIGDLAERGRVLLVLDGTQGVSVNGRAGLPTNAFATPRLRWMLTTRESTGMADVIRVVGPMKDAAAVTLLRRAARDVGVDDPDALDTEALARVAARLDGVPLALSLAGRWLGVLSPAELEAALAERARLVPDDSAPGAHALETAIQESWDRLEPDDRAAIAALLSIEGGFTIQAAAAVWGLDVMATAARLRRLRYRSMLWSSTEEGRPRHHLYAAVRVFVEGAGVEEEAARGRVRQLEQLQTDAPDWDLPTLRANRAWLTTAMQAADHDPTVAARLALALAPLSEADGVLPVLADRIESLLARLLDEDEPNLALVARLYFAVGRQHLLFRDADGAREAFMAARTLVDRTQAQELGWKIDVALAWTLSRSGRPEETLALCEEALQVDDGRPAEDRIRLLSLGAMRLAHSLKFSEAKRWIARAVKASERAGTAEARKMRRYFVDFTLPRYVGDPELALNGEDPPTTENPRHRIIQYVSRAQTRSTLGDLDGARRDLETVLNTRSQDHRLRRGVDAILGYANLLGGPADTHAASLAALDRAATALETSAWSMTALWYRVRWAAGLAATGRLVEGHRALTDCLNTALQLEVHITRAEYLPLAAVVASRVGDRDAARSLLDAIPEPAEPHLAPWLAEQRGLAERAVRGEAIALAPGRRHRWVSQALVKVAAHPMEQAPETDTEAPAIQLATRLEIGEDWRWFRISGDKVSLSRRTATRLILQRLVDSWRGGNAEAVTRDTLLEVGWPGERMAYEAGVARVHTTVWRLRRLGLDDLLVSDDAGYRLRNDIEVVQH